MNKRIPIPLAILIILFVITAIVGVALWICPEKKTTVPQITEQGIHFQDGKYLGYIHRVDMGNLILVFDDAVWLTGKAGEDAAIEAGHCMQATRSECLPNDYFIKNATVADELLLMDQSVLLFMQTWKMEESGEVAAREIGLADFAGLINDRSLHWRQLPYTITVEGGKIMRIEEIYIP
jgi:hypothetical protein